MYTAEDLRDRKSKLDSLMVQLDQQTTLFQQKTASTTELQRSKREMEAAIGNVQNEISDAERAAEASDRVFLDRRPELGDPFVPERTATLQDFTLFFFSISFILFTAAICLAIYYQTASIKNMLYGLGSMTLVGLITFVAIVKFA